MDELEDGELPPSPVPLSTTGEFACKTELEDEEREKAELSPSPVEEQSDLSHGTANSDLVEKERKLLAKRIIKEFSVISIGNFDFPYDPYAGAAWPIFQPTDGVFTDRTEQLEQADVRNQTTCLSLCNYIAKKDLLCEYQAGTWEKSFVEGSTTAYRKKGRFENRIAFARKFNEKEDLEDARQKDMQNQERDRKAMEDFHKKQAGQNYPHQGERLHHQEIHYRMQTIWSYVSASLFDSYSRKNIYHFDNGRTIEGHRKPSNLPSEWFSVEKKFYIPVNDRKDFLCKYANNYNKETTEEMERILKENPSWNRMPIRQMVSDWQLPVIVASHVMQKECSGQLRLTEGDRLKARKRLNEMKKILPIGGTAKLADVRRFAQLQEWEIKYWTFIWDNLCSIYKTMPPVALMMNDLREPVDRAFKSLASPSQRETIYLKYEKLKQDFLTERRASEVNVTMGGDRRWSRGRWHSRGPRFHPYHHQGRQQLRVINELDYPYR